MAIVLNEVLIIHGGEDWFIWVLGCGPIIILYFYRIIGNNEMFFASLEESPDLYKTKAAGFARTVLSQKLFKKVPLLFVLCLPILVIIVSVLLLFGQKPDSFIQAFTDTYRHGLSQLDCSNVTCPDGHFLCTIAASGHKRFVQPLRTGVRQDRVIKVNRQLLVSNAFEDLLAEHFPAVHRIVRRLYNFIGGNCKRLYDILGNRWIADTVYILMKPLEWTFVISLYLFDRRPEDRIAKQYLYSRDRSVIEEMKRINQCR